MPVELEFGASGLLRERLEQGEAADVFASANMEHPEALSRSGKVEPGDPGSPRLHRANGAWRLSRAGPEKPGEEEARP